MGDGPGTDHPHEPPGRLSPTGEGAGSTVLAEAQRKIDSLTKNLLECYEELDLIYRLTRELLGTFDAQENVQLVLNEAMDIFEADLGWVVPVETEPHVFEPVRIKAEEEMVGRLEQALVLGCLREGRSRMYYDLHRDLDLEGAEYPDSFLCAVMKTESRVYGALCLGRRRDRNIFTAGDLKLSRVLASTASVALENSDLHQKRLEEEERMIRLQEEFRLARSIQDNLLPKEHPKLTGYDVAGGTVPARSVGGDYYDFIPVDDSHVAICLGDVSGKGMPAALLMAHLQAAVRGQTLLKVSPSRCLGHSNTLLYHSTDIDRFATCFYGILDAREHSLWYANAGHEHPLLFRGDGDQETLNRGGIVLGIMEEASYSEASIPLGPGDLLVVYSDGITDAANGGEQEFGLDRLNRVILENRHAPARVLVDRIIAEVENHAGNTPQTDDMTLMVIKRKA